MVNRNDPGQKHYSHSTIDHTTTASNPGRVEVDWGHYFRCFPQLRNGIIVGLVVGVIAAALPFLLRVPEPGRVAMIGAFVLVVTVAIGLMKTNHLKAHMDGGNTCPAMVLDPQTGLFAVWTDLRIAADAPPVPVIRILSAPLARGSEAELEAGDLISAVALYERPKDGESHWSTFNPIPVVCVTSNRSELDRSFESIPQEHWDALEKGVARIRDRSASLYHLSSKSKR